jgi:hypothetical protein
MECTRLAGADSVKQKVPIADRMSSATVVDVGFDGVLLCPVNTVLSSIDVN